MSDARPPWEVRKITDARELRALAHPTRMALLDLLVSEGPMTASQCGERLGESAASCSYHLRQLAKFGHVHEAEGGTGRERPWRIRKEGISWDENGASPAEKAAGRLLGEVVDEQRFEAWRSFRDRFDAEPAAWQSASFSSDVAAWMTVDELVTLTQRLYDLFEPYTRRDDPAERPAGARPVRFFGYAYPAGSPTTADGAATNTADSDTQPGGTS
jgi:predicted ArsR family transcriptional regulator